MWMKKMDQAMDERSKQWKKNDDIRHFITNLMNRDSPDEYVERAIQRSVERLERGVALLAEIEAKIESLTATNSSDCGKPQQ